MEQMIYLYLGGVLCSAAGRVGAIRKYGWSHSTGLAFYAIIRTSLGWPYYALWKAVKP